MRISASGNLRSAERLRRALSGLQRLSPGWVEVGRSWICTKGTLAVRPNCGPQNCRLRVDGGTPISQAAPAKQPWIVADAVRFWVWPGPHAGGGVADRRRPVGMAESQCLSSRKRRRQFGPLLKRFELVSAARCELGLASNLPPLRHPGLAAVAIPILDPGPLSVP